MTFDFEQELANALKEQKHPKYMEIIMRDPRREKLLDYRSQRNGFRFKKKGWKYNRSFIREKNNQIRQDLINISFVDPSNSRQRNVVESMYV